MKNFDKIIKLSVLALIAICVVGVLVSVNKTSSGGSAVGKAPGGAMAGNAPAGGPSAGGAPRGANAASNAITVEATVLSPSNLVKTIKINGDVSSRTELSLYPDTSGKIVQYETAVGNHVAKGDIVAFVDPSKPGTSYAVSPVRSTISGTVLEIPYSVGETVSSSSPVATIGVLDDLELITYVPEKYVSVLKKGLSAEVSLVPYPDEIFRAAVTRVSPVVDTTSRTVQVLLSVDDPDKRLKPGMFATITLVTQEVKNTMVVPKGAIRTYDGKSVVYVISENGTAERKIVSLGLTNDSSVQILSGLSFGAKVIVSGSVSNGTTVRLAGQEL